MAPVANRVVEIQGGITLANNGQGVEEIQLPFLGPLADLDAWKLAWRRLTLLDKVRWVGNA
jgi:adenine deaminase